MSYSQSKKLTDTEKKLQALRAQLYGKDRQPEVSSPSKEASFNFKSSLKKSATTLKIPTDSYLKSDLLKILLLASLMIGAQIAFYLGIQQGLIKF